MTSYLSAESVRVRNSPHWDRAVEFAVYLFLFGTLVWRRRTGADIEADAVDAAASLRIAFDVLAATLALMAILAPKPIVQKNVRRARLPLVTYFLYGVVAAVGALFAVAPGFVLFRAFEIIIIALVGCAAAIRLGLDDIVRIVHRSLLLMVLMIVVGIIVNPGGAIWSTGGIIPFRLEGGFPFISANTVGAVGLGLFAYGLSVTRWRYSNIILGIVLVLLSQFRTGYVVIAVVLAVWIIARPGFGRKAVALAVLVPAGIIVAGSSVFESAWTRGENSVENLSGRTELWDLSYQVVQRNPILGTGLGSGFRYEVVPLLPHWFDQSISSAHSTWFGSLLGTGYLGVTLVAILLLSSLVIAWRGRSKHLFPLLFLSTILVRSYTGGTIDGPGLTALLTILVVVGAAKSDAPPFPKMKA